MKNRGEQITFSMLRKMGGGAMVYARKHYWMKLRDRKGKWIDLHTGDVIFEDHLKRFKLETVTEVHLWR